MLKTGLLLVLCLPGIANIQYVFAQDKIITISNDTIDCKINKVSSNAVHFSLFNGVVETKSRIKKAHIKSWQILETENSDAQISDRSIIRERWRFSINGGGGYRIASTKETRQNLQNEGIPDSEIDSYFRQVKTGIKTSGQVHYMFWENYGLGIDYQFHYSSGSLRGTADPGDTFTLIYGKFNDDIFTNYAGISLFLQQWINPKLKFYGQVSSGLTFFREESVIIYTPMLITGKAYGGNSELGLEYFLTKNVSVGLSAGFFQSTISKIKVNNGISTQDVKLEKEQMEGLSRVDLAAGLKFYF